MGIPLLPKCPKIDPFYGAKGKCLFLVKVKQLRNVEKQCVLHFSQIGLVSTPTLLMFFISIFIINCDDFCTLHKLSLNIAALFF
jgi:hypothetical protein